MMLKFGKKWLRLGALAALTIVAPLSLKASEAEKPVERSYVMAPAARMDMNDAEVDAASRGCISCHTDSDAKTMHLSQAVKLGCTSCHGGDASAIAPEGLAKTSPEYAAIRDKGHVLPRYPKTWHYPSSANPKASYTILNKESPEFVRFVNPSDYRVARLACGACHMELIEKAERSLMATGAMFFGGASYNNGILPFKNYVLGEAYTAHGEPATIKSPGDPPGTVTPEQAKRGAIGTLYPAPTWQVVPPGDIFRVFERGGRNINSQFAEVGLPNSTGSIQRLEEPGRPDLKQSNRGPGTGLRVAIPLLNIHKTRLNDPFTWFLGTNDQPGDYRSSGCASCHVVYANNRQPHASVSWAKYGRDGTSDQADPTIPKEEPGHPIKHYFTRAIPTAQCMNCHMHQPNMFLNTYLGYTMWDYESDAPFMWPERQKYPTTEEVRKVLDRNPEGAAPRGLWADLDFLRNVFDLNAKLKDTQFADYHGHGWNFRGIFKRDREGNLLDAEGKIVAPDDPEKWRKAGEPKFAEVGTNPGKTVHLMDIHAEKGMQCADCHFSNDSHGSGLIMGEVANAVEIRCKDCHGTADAYPTLRTSGPAADPKGNDLSLLRNPDGQRRFEWVEEDGRRVLVQRSLLDPKLEWRIKLTKDSVDRASPDFNAKSARAKLMAKISQDGRPFTWGPGVAAGDRAHKDEELECFSCHSAWTTACGGCHLPIEANWKTTMHKYEGEETRNYATYNPQVARDDMYQLGVHSTVKGNTVAPVRSSSALVLSSTNVNRERIYVQQPPIAASGYSSQAFAPHFPHTVRKTETKTCSDCHVSAANDNNAIMAQLLLLGTNFVNFVGQNAWVGLDGGIQATRVTEWSEPQAVFGSYLHRYAYPDYYKDHVEGQGREIKTRVRGGPFPNGPVGHQEEEAAEWIRNITHKSAGPARCLQLRGEYMFVAEGKGGFHVYDVASVANKSFSQPVITAPFSSLGHDTRVSSKNATCMALPTNQNIAPLRNEQMQKIRVKDTVTGQEVSLLEANQEQKFHPIYSYAVITDAEEGLILVNVNTLADGDPRNNKLKRAATWNEGGVLRGARHVTLGGHYAYIAADAGLVVVDLDDPLKPRHVTTVALPDPRASALQFRYLWVTTQRGLEVLDVTKLDQPRLVDGATIPLVDARRVYVARTYAYVAAKKDGLVIVDVMNPERPRIYQKFDAGGQLNDAEDVVVASTNASAFAYVADGRNGLKVLQLTSPSSQPNFYGFSPAPKPEVIAWAKTPSPALALSKGLDRDRAVDETGGQMAIFGRLGSRPFTRPEMERFFTDRWGRPYRVTDEPDMTAWLGVPVSSAQSGR